MGSVILKFTVNILSMNFLFVRSAICGIVADVQWGTVRVCSDTFSLGILLLFIFRLKCWSDIGSGEK